MKRRRRAWFDGGFVDATVYDRYALVAGDRLDGPAIIEEHEATTIVAPGDSVVVDGSGNLRITVAVARPLDASDLGVADAAARIEADPISLEIMWSRLVTVAKEMWTTVCRTALSLVISEAQDFACDLMSPDGDGG